MRLVLFCLIMIQAGMFVTGFRSLTDDNNSLYSGVNYIKIIDPRRLIIATVPYGLELRFGIGMQHKLTVYKESLATLHSGF